MEKQKLDKIRLEAPLRLYSKKNSPENFLNLQYHGLSKIYIRTIIFLVVTDLHRYTA